MSVFSYNGVTLPVAYCHRFVQEAQYDESQTDYIGTKIEIELASVVNPTYMVLLAPDLEDSGVVATENPADVMKVIRSRLLTPRKEMSYTFNGVNLLPDRAGVVGWVDVRNGPQPIACQVFDLTNNNYLINYHVVAHYFEANLVDPNDDQIAINQPGNNVLYSRWSETVEIDEVFMSKRTRNGKVIIRSDNQAGLTADQLRPQFATVGVPPRFLRESSRYTVRPDGLALEYTVVDQQVFKLPPRGASRASGKYREVTGKGDGKRHGEIRVMLRGSTEQPQSVLVTTAMAICNSKMFARGADPQAAKQEERGTILGATCEVDLYQNEVAAAMVVLFPEKPKILKGLGSVEKSMCFTPYSDGVAPAVNTPPAPGRGTAGILLQAAAYYDPALRNTTLDPNTGQFTGNGREVGQAGKNPEA